MKVQKYRPDSCLSTCTHPRATLTRCLHAVKHVPAQRQGQTGVLAAIVYCLVNPKQAYFMCLIHPKAGLEVAKHHGCATTVQQRMRQIITESCRHCCLPQCEHACGVCVHWQLLVERLPQACYCPPLHCEAHTPLRQGSALKVSASLRSVETCALHSTTQMCLQQGTAYSPCPGDTDLILT